MFGTLAVASVTAAVAVAHTVLSSIDHDARRLRRVERDPRLATPADLELLVRAHGVREDKVWAVADRAEAAELDPRAVWTWVMHFDGTELADLCRSRLTHDEVRHHLVTCSSPTSLEVPARMQTA